MCESVFSVQSDKVSSFGRMKVVSYQFVVEHFIPELHIQTSDTF